MGPTGATLPSLSRRRTRAVVVAALAAAGLAAAARSVRRVEVAGWSMAPALRPGDRLFVTGRPAGPPAWPPVGSVVAVRDPRAPGRVLVKRVAAVDRRGGTLAVVGDNAPASTDSRAFGPVDRRALVGRARWRYAPAARVGRLGRSEEYDRSDAQPPG